MKESVLYLVNCSNHMLTNVLGCQKAQMTSGRPVRIMLFSCDNYHAFQVSKIKLLYA